MLGLFCVVCVCVCVHLKFLKECFGQTYHMCRLFVVVFFITTEVHERWHQWSLICKCDNAASCYIRTTCGKDIVNERSFIHKMLRWESHKHTHTHAYFRGNRTLVSGLVSCCKLMMQFQWHENRFAKIEKRISFVCEKFTFSSRTKSMGKRWWITNGSFLLFK